MSKIHKKETKNQSLIDSYDYLSHAASSTDCTGLMPTPAKTEAERESYEAIYPFEPPHLGNTSKK